MQSGSGFTRCPGLPLLAGCRVQELLELVNAGQRVAALRAHPTPAPAQPPEASQWALLHQAGQTKPSPPPRLPTIFTAPGPLAQERDAKQILAAPGSSCSLPGSTQVPALSGAMPLGHGPGGRARTGQADPGRPPSPPAPLPAATTPTAEAMPPSQPCSPGRPAPPASLAAQQQQTEACPAPTDPPAARATMTVVEAALAAFQQEQRLLHRARKQLHKVPLARQAAATQASRAEVAAAYRRLPPPPQQPGAAYAVGARQQGPPRPAPLQPPSPSAVLPGGAEARQRDGSTSPSPVSVEEEGQQEGWESERLQGAQQGLQPAGPAVGSPPAPLSSDSDSIPVEPQAKQTASSNGVGSFPSCSSAPGSVSEEGSSSSSTAAPTTAQPHPPCSPEVAQPFPAASSHQPALPATAPSPTLRALSSSSSSSSASSEGYETDSGPGSPLQHPGGPACGGAARGSSSTRRGAAIP
ncbi:hypothetical protein QJQ45_021365, partial [Haematococcus lacustris]